MCQQALFMLHSAHCTAVLSAATCGAGERSGGPRPEVARHSPTQLVVVIAGAGRTSPCSRLDEGWMDQPPAAAFGLPMHNHAATRIIQPDKCVGKRMHNWVVVLVSLALVPQGIRYRRQRLLQQQACAA